MGFEGGELTVAAARNRVLHDQHEFAVFGVNPFARLKRFASLKLELLSPSRAGESACDESAKGRFCQLKEGMHRKEAAFDLLNEGIIQCKGQTRGENEEEY